MKPRILFVTANSYAHAYGGILYLARALHARGVDVTVLGHVPRELCRHLDPEPFRVVNLPSLPLGTVPVVRGIVKHLRIVAEGLRPGTHWLFNDVGFFPAAILLKRLLPSRTLIHYACEFLTPEEWPALKLDFFARHAREADLVIDVEPHRAALRRERFSLDHTPLVLPNTLPLDALPPAAPQGTLARLAGGPLPGDRMTLLYAGSSHPTMSFGILAKALAMVRKEVFFLGFIRGNKQRIAEWRRLLRDAVGDDGGRICEAIPRTQLLGAMHEAGAGLIYYPPSDEPSGNQTYCAPTKLYEYVAAGIPVVGTANPSLRDLLESRTLGRCAADDSAEAMAAAIRAVASEIDGRRTAFAERARRIFREELCFERTSGPVVDSIVDLLKRPSRS